MIICFRMSAFVFMVVAVAASSRNVDPAVVIELSLVAIFLAVVNFDTGRPA